MLLDASAASAILSGLVYTRLLSMEASPQPAILAPAASHQPASSPKPHPPLPGAMQGWLSMQEAAAIRFSLRLQAVSGPAVNDTRPAGMMPAGLALSAVIPSAQAIATESKLYESELYLDNAVLS